MCVCVLDEQEPNCLVDSLKMIVDNDLKGFVGCCYQTKKQKYSIVSNKTEQKKTVKF